MKVVLLSTSDTGHGAGVAAYRLHQSLRNAGVESSMLVCEKLSADPHVFRLKKESRNRAAKFLRKSLHKIETALNLIGPQNVFSVAATGIQHHPLIRSADVIHLHNIHWTSHNLSLLLLYLQKPIVWTFHDMWPITGHCFYSYDCNRWEMGCGKCPDLKIPPKLLYDSTALQWRLKKYIYDRTRPVIVSPSNWLADIARTSPLFKKCSISRIPNGIDQNEFKPVDKSKARNELDMDVSRKYILWAASDINDPRKGFSFFEKAMLNLKKSGSTENIVILLIGKGQRKQNVLEQHFQIRNFGHVIESGHLSLIISASDVFVSTSIQDNLPNIVLESLACGTPVAGFSVGGVPDMVKHGINGYLVKVDDCDGLARSISLVLGDPAKLREMANMAVRTVSEEFTCELQAHRHIELYGQVVGKGGCRK